MTTPANSAQLSAVEGLMTRRVTTAQALYWSVRRELWEHRAVYVGPLAAGGVFLLGFLLSLVWLPHRMRELAALGPAQQHDAILMPYDLLAGLLMLTQMLISAFYCFDAFQSERRDRSILFWKSMPVSDLTTVLAKASIPLVILPVVTIAVVVAMQLVAFLLSTAVLLASGQSANLLWTHVSWFQMSLMVCYHIVTVHTLWYAPFYGWFLFISAWARRAAYLWALLPFLAITFLERILFGSTHFFELLVSRFSGGAESVPPPGSMPIDTMTHLTPLRFLASPGLWIGLAMTAGFLAAAVVLRRNREPN